MGRIVIYQSRFFYGLVDVASPGTGKELIRFSSKQFVCRQARRNIAFVLKSRDFLWI
jgi:hypothetical protein